MIVEIMVNAGIAYLGYSANKGNNLDEKALKKYGKAFEMEAEARQMANEKKKYVELRLQNVVRKKNAIIQISMPRFQEVYSKYQKIEIRGEEKVSEYALIEDKMPQISFISTISKKNFTDKELVVGLLVHGMGKMMVKDSEKFLSAARMQESTANVIKEQAIVICDVLDAVVGRADRIAQLLAEFNKLFLKSIVQAEEILKLNGMDKSCYTLRDREVFHTCTNIAAAIADILNIPVVDEEGHLVEEAIRVIEVGETYLQKMKTAMNN